MNINEAVQLAQNGNDEAFAYLYESTYQSKYYLALQYMKNEEAAKDVLQDSYIKAFKNIKTLNTPDAFSGWLGRIVANTAMNALQKNNPTLFSDLITEGEDDYAFDIEDEKEETQPELALSKKDTQELVREMMESLSPEQKMCILMFYMEGISINGIATTLNCSENTVKSRLNYGRKNLKGKAEELQKKGYKLYNIAPVSLLLLLLRTNEKDMVSSGVFTHLSGQFEQAIVQHAIPQSTITSGAVHAAKVGFIHTATGKIVTGVIGVCVAGGVTTGAIIHSQNNDSNNSTATVEPESSSESEQTAPTDGLNHLKDSDYENIIAGNLTKEEFEYVLSGAASTNGLYDVDMSSDDIFPLSFDGICNGLLYPKSNSTIHPLRVNENHNLIYDLSEVNRYLSSLTSYQITKTSDTGYVVDLEANTLEYVVKWSMSSTEVRITDSYESDGQIFVEYDFCPTCDKESEISKGYTDVIPDYQKKIAVLNPCENGQYRIINIRDAYAMISMYSGRTSETDRMTSELYALALKELARNEDDLCDAININTYDSKTIDVNTKYQYFVYDIDGNGIDELIIGNPNDDMDGRGEYVVTIFRINEDQRGYTVQFCTGFYHNGMGCLSVNDLRFSPDGKELYFKQFFNNSNRFVIATLYLEGQPLYNYRNAYTQEGYNTMTTDENLKKFEQECTPVTWYDLDDASGLK